MSSILGSNSSANTAAPFFHEFKKQASFFLKEKIKTARLALTDVTPAQLLTEEATNGNPWGPEARTLQRISRAAFEVDDYWRIVEILHKRLIRFDRKNWRISYNALIVLEHLLTHGPESVAEEFQADKDIIMEMDSFQYIDEKGFNWGLNITKKSERILKLLENGPLLKEERDRARKLTRGIQGFGSFCLRTTTTARGGALQESPATAYGRSHSQFNEHGNENQEETDNEFRFLNNGGLAEKKLGKSDQTLNGNACNSVSNRRIGDSDSWGRFGGHQAVENLGSQRSFKENTAPPPMEIFTGELKPLLNHHQKDERKILSPVDEDQHPFYDTDRVTSSASLLPTNDQILQAC